MSLSKNALLARIYYQIGRQTTDFAVQHSRKEGDRVIWTTRHSFLSLEPDSWIVEQCNHRQILQNEIILDFDRPIPVLTALEDPEIKTVLELLDHDDLRYCIYHTGSKGLHIHIYNNTLAQKNKAQREAFRQQYITEVFRSTRNIQNIDLQKANDSTMIALEYVPHWKTGQPKILLLNHGVEEWEVEKWEIKT